MRQLRVGDEIEKPWWSPERKVDSKSLKPYMVLKYDERETKLREMCKGDLQQGRAIPYELKRYSQKAEQALFEKGWDVQDRHRYLIDHEDYSYYQLVMHVHCDVHLEDDSEDEIGDVVIHEEVSARLIICKLKHLNVELIEGEYPIIYPTDAHAVDALKWVD